MPLTSPALAPGPVHLPPVDSWSVARVLPGLEDLWAETTGDPEIRIAVLDGPVDLSHASLRGAHLTRVETLAASEPDRGPATRHGTHVASLIFGQHHSLLWGVAPRCRGIVLPIYASTDGTTFETFSQLDLARALLQALQHGAHVINVSGGQLSPCGAAVPLLAGAVAECARRGTLIVAAAGNQGCDCLHVPAALDSVLAVGAMDGDGQPLENSNWGGTYQRQGILAPGRDLPGARPGGGLLRQSGTSFATALVSGVAGLLHCLLRKRGRKADATTVRAALLRSAVGCATRPVADCRRLLAGRLNVPGAVSFLTRGKPTMSESMIVPSGNPEPTAPIPAEVPGPPAPIPSNLPGSDAVAPSAAPGGSCSCAGATAPQLVYALGQVDFDFVSEARLDSFIQALGVPANEVAQARSQGIGVERMLGRLEQNPHEATALEWTLNVYGHPVYAIRPAGPFAAAAYEQLRLFLREHLTERVERVSIPGVLAGRTTLRTGPTVPVIVPELRGMASWTTAALADAVVQSARAPGEGQRAAPRGRRPREEEGEAAPGPEQLREAVGNFLNRVYHEVHNLGVLPQERALNYAATNALAVAQVFQAALQEQMELESVKTVRSPVCRPGSDCWDVELFFFYPQRQVQTVRRMYRFTVDVSDVVPVTVGPVRTWSTR